MKNYNAREFKQLLKENGFGYVRTCGSHQLYKRGSASVVVPIHLNHMIAIRLIKENNLEEVF